jgi:hypothetical protein
VLVEGQFGVLVDVASKRDEFLNRVVAESFQGRAPVEGCVGSELLFASR